MTKKSGLGSLLLLGAAAFGAYKYSQMNEQQKRDLKDKGKKIFDDNLGSLKNLFGGSNPRTGANTNSFTQHN
jgi:hypothetical protein